MSSYRDFLEYIRAKVPTVRTANLDFQSHSGDARNTILFTLPGDYEPPRCVEILPAPVAQPSSAGTPENLVLKSGFLTSDTRDSEGTKVV